MMDLTEAPHPEAVPRRPSLPASAAYPTRSIRLTWKLPSARPPCRSLCRTRQACTSIQWRTMRFCSDLDVLLEGSQISWYKQLSHFKAALLHHMPDAESCNLLASTISLVKAITLHMTAIDKPVSKANTVWPQGLLNRCCKGLESSKGAVCETGWSIAICLQPDGHHQADCGSFQQHCPLLLHKPANIRLAIMLTVTSCFCLNALQVLTSRHSAEMWKQPKQPHLGCWTGGRERYQRATSRAL